MRFNIKNGEYPKESKEYLFILIHSYLSRFSFSLHNVQRTVLYINA